MFGGDGAVENAKALALLALAAGSAAMAQNASPGASPGAPLSIGGTLGYIHNGWGHAGLPDWSLGFVYLPALLWMVPASMLMAPVGARLTHRLPVQLLRRIFACFLVFMALRMVWKVYS